MLGSFCAFVATPFSTNAVAQNLDISLFFILAVMSVEVFGVILAGYSSSSKWSLFGGMREAAQVVSYEVPMAICAVIPVLISGTLNLVTIANQQSGIFLNWYIFANPAVFLASFVYFVCATASCKRAPFDLAEAESELVAGFHTEYSGMRWSFFFLAEYASMFAVSGLFTIMFLGGWNGPIPIFLWIRQLLGLQDSIVYAFISNVFGVMNFLLKGGLLVFLMIWIRWTLPRLRIDQVMTTCLKYLLPMSCGLLFLAVAWEVLLPNGLLTPILPLNVGGFPLDGQTYYTGASVESVPPVTSH